MEKVTFLVKYPVYFVAMYAFIQATAAIYNTFFPVYLQQLGFTDTLVGVLLALGPFVSIAAQPFWGIAGDRAKTKNAILRAMLLTSALAILLYPVSNEFYYLFVITFIFSFCNTSILPMQDAITLEAIENTGWRYGPIRMAGTIGFAIMSVLAGWISGWNIYAMFPLFSIACIIGLLTTFKIPKVKGHQSEGNRMSLLELLKNKRLVILTCFMFVVFLTLGYYYSFFPVYFKQMGASNLLVGISMLFSASAEIPFLLFSNKILKKLGIRLTLIIATAVMGVRWLLLSLVSNVYVVPFINMMHGFSFIVCTYCMVIFINQEVPNELKASGQTMFALFGTNLPRILGSIIGGVASDIYGIRQVFAYNGIINFMAIILFGLIFIFAWQKAGSLQSIKNREGKKCLRGT